MYELLNAIVSTLQGRRDDAVRRLAARWQHAVPQLCPSPDAHQRVEARYASYLCRCGWK